MTAREGLESRLFSSESVSMGHPDKVADQISDAVLDSLIKHDPKCRVAVETLVTTGLVVLAGEVTVHNEAASRALEQAEQTARETIRKIGYNDPTTGFDYRSCAVLRAIHGQSADISQGVDHSAEHEQGAGDQGLMFGYACNETKALMPLPIHLAHQIMAHLAELRESGELRWLRPDAKTQVTVEYDGREASAIRGIVLSTQHTEEVIDPKPPHNMTDAAKKLLVEKGIKPVIQRECPQLWRESGITYWVNPTGRFVIGGPHGDCGLTGRKIIVDTYGGRGRHGGGAFSGKDPTKVDRSAAYMGRYIAKNIVASGVAEECEVQLAYAIGVADPVSVLVNTFGTGTVPDTRLQEIVRELFNLQPRGIIDSLNLQRPIYFETARHGHFGRELPIFTWEARDKAEEIRSRAERTESGHAGRSSTRQKVEA